MAVFGIGSKQESERNEKNFQQLCEASNVIADDIARLEELSELFERFTGWDAFRTEYLIAVRLPKLYAVAAKALGADDAMRNQLSGQIAEAEFLAQSPEEIKKKLYGLTLRQKEVQGKITLLDSHKTGSK